MLDLSLIEIMDFPLINN